MRKALSKLGSKHIVVLITAGYWTALVIIGAMAATSYLLLQQMMSAQQDAADFMALADQQKALSQRIVMLANSASATDSTDRPRLAALLESSTETFERNYDRIIDLVGPDAPPSELSRNDGLTSILFSKPHHLDYFTGNLAENGHRFAAALAAKPDSTYRGDPKRARLDETVATAALHGYEALGDQLDSLSQQRVESLSKLNRGLFVCTVAILGLIAAFIFRPLSQLVRRRTDDLVEARNRMAYIASHDGLTGLRNRAFINEVIGDMLAQAHLENRRLAAIQFDLDNFKPINDTLGHAAGDHFLVNVADRLRAHCRADDVCVRIGGDEFLIVTSHAGDQGAVENWVCALLDDINRPMSYSGTTMQSSSSAGVAIFPDDAATAADLFVHADLALYAAKDIGGGRVSFFNSELGTALESRKRLEADLKLAVATETFEVFYQPQISLATSKVTGVEALVRWKHPERGMVSPGVFIPVAEKCGLMPAVGRIVVRKAIREAAAWYKSGLDFHRLAINASGSELRTNDYDAFLLATLKCEGLPTSKLAIEIVESVILDDERTGVTETLRRIRKAGIHLELDDFGTGYASLSHVNPNQIDRLKIDRRFVQNIHANGDNSLIVKAIADLARGLGLSIVAEGAETADELSALQALGCDQVQGYSIAYPMPEKAARDWMLARSAQRGKIAMISRRA